MYQLLADAVLIVHLLFIAFVLGGGLLALRWPRLAWVHVPAAAWGALIEFAGLTCPLTPLENYFLERAGEIPYHGGFIAHYLHVIIYPAGLDVRMQYLLGGIVIALNAVIYAAVVVKARQRPRGP